MTTDMITFVLFWFSAPGELSSAASELRDYQLNANIAGKTCPNNTRAFAMQGVGSLFACGAICGTNEDCRSLFYSRQTGTCDGCVQVYRDASVLTDHMAGGLYYISGCRSGWVEYENSCYYFATNKETWWDALAKCETLGAHHVEIKDSQEHEFILLQYDTLGFVWLGLTDQLDEGHWAWWDSKAPVTYTRIANSNVANRHCATLGSDWWKVNCDLHRSYVCERELK